MKIKNLNPRITPILLLFGIGGGAADSGNSRSGFEINKISYL